MVRVGLLVRCASRCRAPSRCARRSSRCSPTTPKSDPCSRRCWSWPRSAQPVCGVVFALDGVLIGAGDNSLPGVGRGLGTLASFVPLALLVLAQDAGLVWLWWAFDVFLVARLVTLVVRWRGEAWLTPA